MSVVLIVDDDPDICAFVVELLTEEGYAAATVSNGQEALTYLRQAAQLPCLILLDLHMPVMNAWDFRATQLRNPRLAQIPVVLFSTAPNLGQMVIELGAVAALTKPIQIEGILAVMEQYCAPDGA